MRCCDVDGESLWKDPAKRLSISTESWGELCHVTDDTFLLNLWYTIRQVTQSKIIVSCEEKIKCYFAVDEYLRSYSLGIKESFSYTVKIPLGPIFVSRKDIITRYGQNLPLLTRQIRFPCGRQNFLYNRHKSKDALWDIYPQITRRHSHLFPKGSCHPR